MVRSRSAEKKAQFLSSALKLFVMKGVQHTSTAEIAKEAGTAAGTLFLYFPTKQDLLNDLVLKIARDQSEFVNSYLSPSLPVRDTFLTIWKKSIHWFLENADAFQFVQQVRDSGMIAETTVQESEKYLGYYHAAFQKGIEEGSIMAYPLELTGGILYQDIVAVMNLVLRQPDLTTREEYIRLGFVIFWNGIRVPDSH